MPFYKFKCNKCEKESEEFWSMQTFEKNVVDSTAKEPCECGGSKINQIGLIGMGLDIYKNDPNSNQYWKKGKSNQEISQIIEHSHLGPY